MFTAPCKKVLLFASCQNGCFDLSSAFLGNGQKQTSGCRCSALKNKSCVISRPLTGSEAQRLLHRLHLRGQPTAAKDHTATTARWKWNKPPCISCDGVSRHSWDSKIPLRSAAWESTKIWFLMSKINIMLVHVPESADCVPWRGLRENLTLRKQNQSKK